MESVTHLSGGHATDSGSENLGDQATASISPQSGRVVLVAIGSNKPSGTPNTPTVSGLGMTWTLIGTALGGTGNHKRITLYLGIANGSTGSLTISHGGQLQQNIYWDIVQLNNTATSGTNGSDCIVQHATNQGTGVTSFSVTLGVFSSALNGVLGAVYQNTSQDTTPGSGFTEIADIIGSHGIETEFKASNDTSVDWSVSGAADYVAIAVELKAAPTGGGILAII